MSKNWKPLREDTKNQFRRATRRQPFPILFFVYLFEATEGLREELTFNNIYEITHADDQNFYSQDEGAINDSQNKIENSYAKFRLRGNTAKTERFNMTSLDNVKILGKKINTKLEIKKEYKSE